MGSKQNPSRRVKQATFIILGPQGSGKGTQAHFLIDKFNFSYLATGDVCREISKLETNLGHKVNELITSGAFLSDEMIMQIFQEKLESLPKSTNIIFDGIPRTLPQARSLDELLKEIKIPLPFVIFLDISREEAIKRLQTRKVCQSCHKSYLPEDSSYLKGICVKCGGKVDVRHDDNEKAIKNRLDLFYDSIDKILDFYRKSGRLIYINGEQSVSKVSHDISKKVEKFL